MTFFVLFFILKEKSPERQPLRAELQNTGGTGKIRKDNRTGTL